MFEFLLEVEVTPFSFPHFSPELETDAAVQNLSALVGSCLVFLSRNSEQNPPLQSRSLARF